MRRGRILASCAALAALVALAACATWRALPEPPASAVSPPSLTLADGDGNVGPRTRARVTASLVHSERAPRLEQHLAAMETLTDEPLYVGNRVALLVDGPRTYAAMFAAIENASEYVNVESYIFGEAQAGGRRLSDLLIDRARAGVAVNVLYDALGSATTDDALLERLRAAGVTTCAFNPLNPLKSRTGEFVQRTHRKIVVVDGATAFTGGLNLSPAYRSSSALVRRRGEQTLEDGWRDTHVRVDGPVVRSFQTAFLESWQKQQCGELATRDYLHEPPRAGDTLVRLVKSSVDADFGTVYAAKLTAVEAATASIDLTMAYFAPDERLERALRAAARRGVEVRLLLPGFSDFSGVWYAARAHYAALLRDGIRIYEYSPAFMHAKTMTVDDLWSTVGSTNWDYRSLVDNDELNVIVIDAAFGREMRTVFERDLASAREITLAEWRERPLTDRFLERFWVTFERWL